MTTVEPFNKNTFQDQLFVLVDVIFYRGCGSLYVNHLDKNIAHSLGVSLTHNYGGHLTPKVAKNLN